MARHFWKGSISFGMVEIPVTLRPALNSDDLSFTLLDRKDFSPVGNRRYNKSTGREVDWDDVVRGYEYEPDEYVVVSDEELRQANPKATGTIEIVGFVELAQIDPVYFDTPYYVEPIQQASKSYTLLRETLERTGKAAIARVVLRTRQHLAAVTVRDGALVLNLLHYAHELVPAKDLKLPAGGRESRVTPQEIKLAERLVEGMTSEWDPASFRDEYRDDVMKLIERKVKSGDLHTIVEPEKRTERRARREVVDLMPLLKQSVEAQAARGGRGRAPARAKRPRTERAERGRRRSA
jgi:DNA end-binding protein Ku